MQVHALLSGSPAPRDTLLGFSLSCLEAHSFARCPTASLLRLVARAFIEWRNQPLSIQHNPLKTMTRAEIAKMLLSEGSDLADLNKYETYRWFVELNQDVVGNVSLKNISHSMGYAEIGYGIAESHHGQGIATEAVRLLVAKVFNEAALRKLMAFVHDKNQSSRRVLEKLRFRQEGLLREHYLINGKPVDEILYSILRQEWSPSLE
jgi:[ribosomal protein S5]-alanine N-acetyltransferase